MAHEEYVAQVQLMLRILLLIKKEGSFALKGGTAINLFYRDLPRLSVDIDLTYVPIQSREESLSGINAAMDRIMKSVRQIPGVSSQRIRGGGGMETSQLKKAHLGKPRKASGPNGRIGKIAKVTHNCAKSAQFLYL